MRSPRPVAIADLAARKKDRVFDASKIKARHRPCDAGEGLQKRDTGQDAQRVGRATPDKDFFDIGVNGVCHAIFPEKGFIRPGYTVIHGRQPHLHSRAFGAFAAGIGTTDLEVGILKGVCAFRQPSTIRVAVNATRKGVYAKDVILEIIRTLTVNGATDRVIEFTGPVVEAMTMESV